ncbi:MAG: choice-of-anchor D domain-containing protein [Acidobacteria bacterium]|nr:MAG: choice-of-anchor D domain-containing protein [Acidobacteriota bacterium]
MALAAPAAAVVNYKLNAPMASDRGDVGGGEVRHADHPFQISPDGRWVVYVATADEGDVSELFSVPIDGGPAIKLNPPLVAGGDVRAAAGGMDLPFQISPDSRRVVYLADQQADQVFELFSVPIDGGPATRLNPPPRHPQGDVRGGQAHPFRISPDGRRVVYVADFDVDEVFELFSVPIDGGRVTQLNPLLAGGRGDVRGDVPHPFLISPDSTRVVYLADQEADEVVELYSVAIDGGGRVKLNPTPVAEGDVRGADPKAVEAFLISPDSTRVVYLADQETDEVFELFSVPIDGGPAIKLNPTLAGGRGDVRGPEQGMPNPFVVSPDSRWVAYVADQETDSVFELFSVPIDGGPAIKLNPVLAEGRGEIRGADNMVAHPFRFTPDSRRVLYVADQEIVGVMELFMVPVGGGRAMRLNPTLAQDQGALVGADYELDNPFLISPDGRYAVYVADQDTDEVIELYASRLGGINVRGQGLDVVDGDVAPRPGDGTDFGAAGEEGTSRTFTIENLGPEPLTLGRPAIGIDGEASGDFRLEVEPAARVAPGDATTFTLRFVPGGAGLRRATVSIAHDGADPDGSYRFAVQGRAGS